MTTYRARYQHDGRAWTVQFVEPDIATWGRSLRSAKAYARELLAAYLGVQDLGATDATVEDVVDLGEQVESELGSLGAKRRQVEALRQDVVAETRRAAQRLRQAGLSVRDVGELLGVSPSRVMQLEREAADS